MQCPRCAAPLIDEGSGVAACAACNRGFVDEAVMVGRIESLTGRRAWAFSDQPAAGDACPRCAARMERGRLHGVAMDRCRAHGLWFDRDELARAVHTAEAARTTKLDREDRGRQREGLLGLLDDLIDFFS